MNWINYWKTKVIIRYEFQKANFPMEFISCVRKLILLNILKQEAGELLISAFKNVAGNGSKEYKLCLKYDQSSYTSNASKYYGKDVLPLIRLPEMYYIIAECETDKNKSAEALNTVMWTRGIAYEDGVIADDDYDRLDTRAGYDQTHTKRVNELMREYRKEFFSEGQLFYFYKRHNYKTFPYCVIEDLYAYYQWPFPDIEKSFGYNN